MLGYTLLALLGTASAINLVERRDAVPRVVQHSIQRKHVESPIARDRARLRKRTDTVQVSLENEETLYFMNVSIGTPAQKLLLHLDTGSSDLWVNVPTSTYCEVSSNDCAEAGTYIHADSSTYKLIDEGGFNITYVDGSGASGDYVSDVVAFGGITIDGQEFGIGYTSSSPEGILGIGYPLNEVAVSDTDGTTYANVPVKMVDTGLISTNAYSLWLNDLDASTGNILFGGVNTDKFSGELETVPILTEDGVYAEFIIALTEVGMNGTKGSIASDIAVAALLDSGSSLMYLPNAIAEAIYTELGATYDSSEGAAIVDCDLANDDRTIDFTFSTPTISVSMHELVIVAGTSQGKDVCILGIGLADDSTTVLGDTFLRSAYVVYDIAANEISLAQTIYNVTTDNIKEITNSSGIPDSTTVSSAVTSVTASSAEATSVDTSTTESSSAFAIPTIAPDWAFAGVVGAGLLWAL